MSVARPAPIWRQHHYHHPYHPLLHPKQRKRRIMETERPIPSPSGIEDPQAPRGALGTTRAERRCRELPLEPPPTRWWKAVEMTPREKAACFLVVVLATFSLVTGLGFFLHHGISVWYVFVPLWVAWLAAAVLLQLWELRRRKEQRDRRVQWERERAMLQAAP